MYTLRTRFAQDVVCEFLPPSRRQKLDKVIILADGMPSVPSKKLVLEFFSKKGFWVFHPRYRGAWESDGKFLDKSPHLDILDVIEGIHRDFVSIWDYDFGEKKVFKLKPKQLIVIGSSFGGPAAIINSSDSRVTKAVAISPIIDWRKPGRDEPIPLLAKFTESAFGNGYRTTKNGWAKVMSGKFYNPVNQIKEVDSKKLLLIHAKDDTVCPYSETKKFATQTKAKLVALPKGGHLGQSLLMTPRFYKIFKKFIDQK